MKSTDRITFFELLRRAIKPSQEEHGKEQQTNADDYAEKQTHSDKTGDASYLPKIDYFA